MKAYRASLLWFAPADEGPARALFEEDGLLVVGPAADGRQVVQALGPYRELAPAYPGVAVEHFPGRIIAPGFVDLHLHYPQTNGIGSPADGLLPWLENYTFPEEIRFAAPDYCAQAATFFVAELLRNGVTTALVFVTSHPQSVDALFTETDAMFVSFDYDDMSGFVEYVDGKFGEGRLKWLPGVQSRKKLGNSAK